MEFTIIALVLSILGFLVWRSYLDNKKQDPHKPSTSNPGETRRM